MKPLVVHASTHGSFKSHGGSVASFNNLTTSLPTFDSPPPSPPPLIPEVELKMFWIWRKVVIREKKEERNGNGSMNIELNKVERSLEKILRKFDIGPCCSRNQFPESASPVFFFLAIGRTLSKKKTRKTYNAHK